MPSRPGGKPVPAELVAGYATKGVPSCHDPAKAKALLTQAAWRAGSDRVLHPTSVSRPYMLDPKKNAERSARVSRTRASGHETTPRRGAWTTSPRCRAARPDLPARLDGDSVIRELLNVHFGAVNDQFGFNNPALFTLLNRADCETNLRSAQRLPAGVDEVMKFLPAVPYATAHRHWPSRSRYWVQAEPRLPGAVRAGLLRKVGNWGDAGGRLDAAIHRPPATPSHPDSSARFSSSAGSDPAGLRLRRHSGERLRPRRSRRSVTS